MLAANKNKKRKTQSQKKEFSHEPQNLKFKSQQQIIVRAEFRQIDYNLNMNYKQKEVYDLEAKIDIHEQRLKKTHKDYLEGIDQLDHIRSKYNPQIQRLRQQIYQNNKKKRALLRNKKDLIEKNKEKPSNDAQFQIQQLQAEIDHLSKITAGKQHQLSSRESDRSTEQENIEWLRKKIDMEIQIIQDCNKQLLITQGIKISKYNY